MCPCAWRTCPHLPAREGFLEVVLSLGFGGCMWGWQDKGGGAKSAWQRKPPTYESQKDKRGPAWARMCLIRSPVLIFTGALLAHAVCGARGCAAGLGARAEAASLGREGCACLYVYICVCAGVYCVVLVLRKVCVVCWGVYVRGCSVLSKGAVRAGRERCAGARRPAHTEDRRKLRGKAAARLASSSGRGRLGQSP